MDDVDDRLGRAVVFLFVPGDRPERFEKALNAGADAIILDLEDGVAADRKEAARAGIPLGKFVIPNPFGPYEDPRFTSYLMKTWFAGRSAAVNTPAYVRDNIHVSLLSSVYTKFAAEFAGNTSIHPSGYPESQGAFAMRFAHEMRPRLNMRCELELKQQVAFAEPRVRINTDVIDSGTIGWDEARAWDELADYYKTLFAPK